MNKPRKIWLACLWLGAVALISAGFVFGWDGVGVVAGVGAGLGSWLGVRWGNKRAKEADAYREEWLNKRKKRTVQRGDQPEAGS